MKREDAFSRLNLAKINQEWRTVLRNVKCVELRNELKSVQKYFHDALRRKNQTIERLLFEMDESEEMYATMMHSHMENVERLIGKLIQRCLKKIERRKEKWRISFLSHV